jgi:hypothetical protein
LEEGFDIEDEERCEAHPTFPEDLEVNLDYFV